MKQKKPLSFGNLRKALSTCFNKIPEYRQPKKIDYSIHDVLMSGFACMHFQDPSLLQFQKRLEKKHHRSNLQSLLHVKAIPESTQLRDVTDTVDSQHMEPFFDNYFSRLQRSKQLLQFQLFPGLYMASIDGTEYFSSYSVSCNGCLTIKSKGKKRLECDEELCAQDETGVRYSHKALQVAIMCISLDLI